MKKKPSKITHGSDYNFETNTRFITQIFEDGSIYKGFCLLGKPHGYGKLIHGHLTYEGFFSQGNKHGTGLERNNKNGIIYVG